MSKIKIKNFGPIKEGYQENDGWMDVKKVTTFIGNQGSGKSTVAKLISTFTWMEKALTRGDITKDWFTRNDIFNQHLIYHRINNYLRKDEFLLDNSVFEYSGEVYDINYTKGDITINEKNNENYLLPKIMYIPAERNLVTYLKNPKNLSYSSEPMSDFIAEYYNAAIRIDGKLRLPINEIDIELNNITDQIVLIGKDYKIDLTEASSGFQAFIPLFLVSWFLANSIKTPIKNNQELMTGKQRQRFRDQVKLINENNNLTDEQKRIALSEEANRINKKAFINIVEEPEQNLFPNSQWQMLKSLLEFNNMNEGNKLIITTHSPYIINYLSIAIQGEYLKNKIDSSNKSKELIDRLEKIVPVKSLVSSSDVAIYELEESDGIIKKLPDYKGIPSDKNYLNSSLAEGNQLFDALLEIEEEL